MYFNGCHTGTDCPCCGDRWYKPWDDEGTEMPDIYGKSPVEYIENCNKTKGFGSILWMSKGKEICVHYEDGRKEWF